VEIVALKGQCQELSHADLHVADRRVAPYACMAI
jgi:hypothetical protein